jgi:hypothetical protein
VLDRIQRATAEAREELRRSGKLLPVALLPPEMPRPFREFFERVLALEAGGPRQATLETHYLDLMPRMRAQQLCSAETPAATFFQAKWSHLPRLQAAIARLREALRGICEVRAEGETIGELYQTTFYGGFMPLLYGMPADLAHFARAPGTLDEVIDCYLVAPIVHELTHLHRDRRAPSLHLDECVAGWLGVSVLPQFAYPDGDEGLFASPWFAQVGQALARVAGRERLLRAHAGVMSWEEALPAGLAAALERLGWEDYVESRRAHFLSDNFHPDPWLKLFYLAQAGAPLTPSLAALSALPWREVPPGGESPLDAEMVRDGLRAMCLDNFQVERSYRVKMRPPPGPIFVDAANCRISAAGGPFDPAGLAYLLPPPIAARLPCDYVVELRSLSAIDEVARALTDGAPARETAAYSLSARPRPASGSSAAGPPSSASP